MNSALLSRFDLVFILLDKPNVEMDQRISGESALNFIDHIMKVHAGNLRHKSKQKKWGEHDQHQSDTVPEAHGVKSILDRLRISPDEQFDPIPPSILRKFVAYARKYAHPVLSHEAAGIIQEFYLNLREKYRSSDSIPITTRQLESMVRLCEARARAELRETVTASDAEDGIYCITPVVDIMKMSLWESYQDENGNMDFQRSQHGTGVNIA